MNENLKMKNDIVFKAFFSRNERFLKSFLNAILEENVVISKVKHDVRLEQFAKEMKYGVLDLEVELESGESVTIEMQLKNYRNIEQRTTFYASKKIVEQIKPSQNYEELKKVIVIAILDYNFIDLPEYITETIRVVRKHKEYELNNFTQYYYIELPKFRNSNPDMNIKVNQWLSFLDMERGDLLEMAKKKNKEVKEAFDNYEVLTGDEEVKRLAEIRLLSELEEHSALATARAIGTEKGLKEGIKQGMQEGIEKGKQEGIKQGIKEGKEQGIKEGKEQGIKEGKEQGIKEGIEKGKEEGIKNIVEKMLINKMPIEKIIEYTGLTELEIKELKKEIEHK